MTNYHTMFQVNVSHSYFQQGLFGSLQCDFGESFMALAKKYRLKIDTRPSGFVIFSTYENVAQFFQYITNTTGLTYIELALFTTDSNFYNYTAFPLDFQGMLQYSSDFDENVHTEDALLLAQKLVGSTSQSSIATIKIHFDDILNELERSGVVRYKIEMQARATQWQYFIMNRSKIQLISPEILGASEISFSGPSEVTLENGENALLFSTKDQYIKLSEIPKYQFNLVSETKFSLKNQQPKKTKIVFNGLPNPSPERITIKTMDAKTFATSPMYIYV